MVVDGTVRIGMAVAEMDVEVEGEDPVISSVLELQECRSLLVALCILCDALSHHFAGWTALYRSPLYRGLTTRLY